MRHLRLLTIPIWGEARVALEHAALQRDPVLRGEGVPRGDGAPVLLVPGFLAGDPSLTTMARWLKGLGYRPCRAEMRINVDCTARGVERLEGSLERLAERHGRKVAIVGQSRGGAMARVLAVRRPDLVHEIVTLGSPLTNQLAIHPFVRAQATLVGVLGTLGVPGLFRYGCQYGDCCAEIREQATGPLPRRGALHVRVLAQRRHLRLRACLDPSPSTSRCAPATSGMGCQPARNFRVVGETLGGGARRRRLADAA
jgi:pimeloyl-ACP methyl ester carboxylesterase